MIKPYEVSRQKLIYVYGIPDSAHHGLLKIGETTFTGDLELDARRRIDAQTKAAGIPYKLFHTELALTDKGETFRDKDVHQVLLNSNIKKKSPNNTKAQEWFKVDLDTVKAAILAVKKGEPTIDGKGQPKFFKVIFRDEQEAAIKQTVNYFKHGKEFLWNAKMRFGKTLCALEVVRRMKFDKTIIVTHRPDVKAGWSEDFKKIFGGSDDFEFGKRDDFYKLIKSGKNFVCFVSIQDLRGSETVGGKFEKNDDLFNTDWNCVIVDEAHEGTQTALGDAVIKKLVKKNSKFLALSGTPFNIIDDYNDENTFTWDYIMEQKAKADWEENFPDVSNPYADLPKMNIYTYNLGELIKNPAFIDAEDKSFSFNEFFRIDGEAFAHESDVKNFLDMLVHRDATNYPYAEENFRKMFRHTLWIIPGVKEGRALSRLLQNHRVFHNFKIVNVAGDGDSDDEPANALDKVRSAIDNYEFTITLSCGKLTTGVTVPEWSAVFMLRGGSSAMSYLQTIFRVQTPCRKYGELKENCYVFDFAPDRTLKFITEAVAVSARAGRTTDTHRKILDEFLKFCPVIAMHGSKMSNLNSQKLLRQLKKVYAERAVHSGFEDNSLYNDNLYNLTDFNLNCLKKVKGIIGSSKSQAKMSDITVNAQGLTPKEIREYTKGQKHQLTPEEKEKLLRKRQRLEAISILRGISIRIPLLIYGADVPIDDDISIDNFTDLIDKESWKEFMPNGITQEIFNNLIEFYDREVFIEAGHIIRERAKAADRLAPIERVEEIANLFDTFKNPDKETVLTPWNVVKMHIDSAFDDEFFSQYKRILEINSKTGLYPLYVAEKIFKARLKSSGEKNFSIEQQRFIWNTTIADNVFVICKTPMAKAITIRTLLGYRKGTVNAEYFADIIETLKHTPSTFIDRVTEKDFWHKGAGKMFFDAVVGNPPYQVIDYGNNKTFASPVYHLFMETSFKLADKVSLSPCTLSVQCRCNASRLQK